MRREYEDYYEYEVSFADLEVAEELASTLAKIERG